MAAPEELPEFAVRMWAIQRARRRGASKYLKHLDCTVLQQYTNKPM
jgi:hypothetical protein